MKVLRSKIYLNPFISSIFFVESNALSIVSLSDKTYKIVSPKYIKMGITFTLKEIYPFYTIWGYLFPNALFYY